MELRDRPLEKLWGGGGGGEFSRRKNLVRYQIPCMNFFQAIACIFLGLIGVQEFFFI